MCYRRTACRVVIGASTMQVDWEEGAMGSESGGLGAAIVRVCRDAFDRWERFASSRRGLGLMFAWAAGEATVWPIIPDFLLIPMAVGNRRRFSRSWAAAVAGMALGGA